MNRLQAWASVLVIGLGGTAAIPATKDTAEVPAVPASPYNEAAGYVVSDDGETVTVKMDSDGSEQQFAHANLKPL